jgi:hypothetical protein
LVASCHNGSLSLLSVGVIDERVPDALAIGETKRLGRVSAVEQRHDPAVVVGPALFSGGLRSFVKQRRERVGRSS